MGAAPLARLIALAAVLAPASAHAERCVGANESGARYPICFDPGNRLFVDATSRGFGAGIALRHQVHFVDEPDLVWKLEHHIADAEVDADGARVALYRGRFLRHARDGHLVLPFAVNRKIFLPFDIGGEAAVGNLDRATDGTLAIDVVDAAALIDLARTEGFGRRLAIGAQVRWSIAADRDPREVSDHTVSPLSTAVVDAGLESGTGLSAASLRLEAGRQWSTSAGWHNRVDLAVALERVFLAINDRPLSLCFGAGYRREQGRDDARAEVGVRIGLLARARTAGFR